MDAADTASTCTPATMRGSHVFTVTGYSQHRGMGVGKFVRSGTFFAWGHEWAIRFYPDGFDKTSSDFVSVYVELLSKDPNVHASCDIRLIDQITGLSSSLNFTPPRVLNHNDLTRFAAQTGKFVKRNEFEASAYLANDQFIIKCVLTVIKEPLVSHTISSPKFGVPMSDIAAHLGKLLEEKEGTDVTLCVGENMFPAHKIILAMRSPVFKAQLFGPMRETGRELISIEDMQPDVFKALLHFIYTDSLDIIDDLERDDCGEMVRHLLVATDRYGMERLKIICESILCKNIGLQTVATMLALADQHHCGMLKDACIEFICSSSIDDIVATQGFVDLKTTCSAVLVDTLPDPLERGPRSVKRGPVSSVAVVFSVAAVFSGHLLKMSPKKTASTCTTETAEGCHVFSISGYSKTRGMGAGKFVRSATFSVGGHDWVIRFYADGLLGFKDYIFIYLHLLGRGVTVHASSDIRLVDQTTGLSTSVKRTATTLSSCYDSGEFTAMDHWYKNRIELEQSDYLRDDRLDIECVVTVMKEPRVSLTKSSPKVVVPPSDITVHLGKLLESKEAADVTFYVGEDTFVAHKIVLAMRSTVFKVELFGPMKEAGAQVIPIKDMQPDVFKALLHFIYTDSLPSIDDLVGDDRGEMIRHLLVAADRYAMERLKLICESDLCENLDVQSVAATLALADQHHCASLKDACIEFMSFFPRWMI
uniref:BTB domain-containing protein n=1 Tax=Leersia perrieri TaxID=77586 RepID=A0A0D9X5K6_9ORYZ